MTWKVTNSQDYAPKYVRYLINTEAVTPGTVNYNFGILAGTVDVDWGDGTSDIGVSTNTTHTYSSPGYYVVTISQNGTSTFRPDIGLQEISVEHESVEGGGFWDSNMRSASASASNLKKWGSVDLGNVAEFGTTNPSTSFQNTGAWYNCNSLTSFPAADLSSGTEYGFAWSNCTSMTTFGNCTFNTTPNSYSLNFAWYNCVSLTTFPALDLSGVGGTANGAGLFRTWDNCTGMTSFGAITLPSATPYTAQSAWDRCLSLTSFPGTIDLSQCTNLQGAWSSCTSLSSFPGTLDLTGCSIFGSGPEANTNFRGTGAWYNCTSLTSFPALDLSTGTQFGFAWYDCTSMTTFGNCTFNTAPNSYSLNYTWYNCSSLTTFPALDLSGVGGTANGAGLFRTWDNCTGMTSFGAITLPSATPYTAQSAWNRCLSLTSFPGTIDLSQCTNLQGAWSSCTSLSSFPGTLDLTGCSIFGDGPETNTNFRGRGTWHNCTSLTSFPALDLSTGTQFGFAWYDCTSMTTFGNCTFNTAPNSYSLNFAWYNCSSLTTFPALDLSGVGGTANGAGLYAAWRNCSGMTSFGAITLPSATPYTAQNAWLGCSSLTSFPALSFTSCTNFTNAWQNCTTLATFPANVFDTTGTLIGTAFSNAFFNCALTALSIENILVSLDTNGASNITLDLQGGTNAGASTWTAAANTAYSNLIAKGWTISANP